jgi:hypothetical protein
VDPGDVVIKSQLDAAVIAGGQVKELLLHEDQLNDAEGILASVAFYIANNPTSGDQVILTDGTTTRSYGFGTGGDVTVTIGATAADTMQNLATAIEGDGLAIWGAAFSTDLDSINAGGVVVITEDDNDGTASKIYGNTWGTPADGQIVDYGGETQYNKKTSSQLPGSLPGSTNFGFRRTQASLSAGEIHYIEEKDVLWAWDSDTDTWMTMTGPFSIPDATGDSGGGIKGKITVDTDFGLAVALGVLSINLDATPGLEFNSGALRVKTDGAHGIVLGASGVEIEIDDTPDTLDVDADGLKVVGLPSLFKVNNIAVGATVTAANLDTLTDGSDASALHTHEDADESERVENVFTAGENITQGDPVYIAASGSVMRADADLGGGDQEGRVVGVAKETITSGNPIQIVTVGPILNISGASWTIGGPVYLGVGGGLTQTKPTPNNLVCEVGYAMGTDDLFVLKRLVGQRTT